MIVAPDTPDNLPPFNRQSGVVRTGDRIASHAAPSPADKIISHWYSCAGMIAHGQKQNSVKKEKQKHREASETN